MFVRKKKNKSGSVTVQIVDKSDRYRILRPIGTARDVDKIEYLVQKAAHILRTCDGKQAELFEIPNARRISC